ncbi:MULTISPECIES: hypothetical protein [unclassified Pseudofrankia]|uniref:hypothetical protein n=1 Tax=unclassified Pseudofrankia TaxID=2994372 RepID=UPI0008D91995|nr:MULTISPECIES: hypothetical protein [unclassified Pseudofrankia]MDT3446653.1 hypothetical protein [Pseudofrankia sp. BMG5.37]OHV44358.1 hypothetical protein BCD48_02040 [Pseudofrankia sp. BMG5.36]
MGSSLRNRLSRVTGAAPSDTRRGRDARGQERGGVRRRLRPGGMVEQRSGRGHEGGGPISGLLGTSQLFGGAGSGAPGHAGIRAAFGDGGQEWQAGLQTAARGAAGRAGSAVTGAAGLAARASQSAASATRDASSTLAHRMSDASSRMSERSDRMSERSDADLGWAASRIGERPRRERGRAWDERRDRPSWETPGQRPWGEPDGGGRTGRTAHVGRRRATTAPGEEIAGRVEERTGRLPGRGQPWGEEGRQERFSGEGGQRREQPSGRGRGAGRRGERGEQARSGDLALRERGGEPSRWAIPEGLSWEEISGGQDRVRGVSKRHQRRIEKAQSAADDLTQRAYEASERAMRHSHSRRARRSERKTTVQADRAQRLLEQHLTRAERRMAQSHQRRRRGVGLLLLAGAGAGAAVAARRYLGQQGTGQPAMPLEEQAGQRPMPTAPGGFPGTDRLSERMASEATSGRVEEMPGVDTMSDPSAPRRF